MSHITDFFSEQDLQTALDEKLVNKREDNNGLYILNYSDRAVYTAGAWDNSAVRHSRGMIIDTCGNIIARGWSKFFNHNQPQADNLDPNLPVEVSDKVDGSLGICYYNLKGEPKVATPGSFTSDQAIHGTHLLSEMGFSWNNSYTPLVEIVYPENRIVLDYNGADELILLGCIHLDTNTYYGPNEAAKLLNWPSNVAEIFGANTLAEAYALPPRKNAEGICIRQSNKIIKVKQDDYIQLHRIVTGLSVKSVWQHMYEGGSLEELLEPLPDELHQWATEIYTNFDNEVANIKIECQDTYNRITNKLPADFTRADFAKVAKETPKLMSNLFAMLDGKDYRPIILKTLKPVGNITAVHIDEDVA